jgi:hypothetical protein
MALNAPYGLIFAIALFCAPAFTTGGVSQALEPETELQQVQQLFQRQRRSRPQGGRRGGLCLVSPAGDTLQDQYKIWSDRPLFLWQANPQEITVRRIQLLAKPSDEILWERILAANQADSLEQKVLYDGPNLKLGQDYGWVIEWNYKNDRQANRLQSLFNLIEPVQHQQISAALGAIANSSQANTPPETIALRQANYLADRGLLSDALQVLYGVQPASGSMLQLRRSLVQSACESSRPVSPGGAP